ncbi:MAG: 2-oxoacid:acceptor oxidoreductase subunit alpha [Rhodobacteraceae bacterium]|nr:2-oxoacid:acceptor oxidoreductase subunit alpha [Paracoccaceae bacterium]
MTISAKLDDLTIMVAGQGGDGSLTVMNVLSELFGRRGYHLYKSRNVASRIKGGIAAAQMRASVISRGCTGDQIDLVVAFDQEAVTNVGADLSPDAVVVFDSSDKPLDRRNLADSVRVIEIPFGRYAVRDLRRDLFKNSMSFGVISQLMNIDQDEAEDCLRHTLHRLPERVLLPNIDSFADGRKFALADKIASGGYPWHLERVTRAKHLMINGNDAIAFGFMAAGGRFFCGYPITPATEILEWLQKHLPAMGGVAMQAEDELAAINIALGAAMTGVRTMTATSSPGFSLMAEGISHSGSAEIPLVITNSQRAGPSTGMPTKPEQSDIAMMIHCGNGEFPRVVLAPGDPGDCFKIGAAATNLAQRIQGPVIIAVDQAVAQDARSVTPFDLEAVEPHDGARMSEDALQAMATYRRYELNPSGVSPWAVPGTKGGMSLVTGNERNEWGLVTTVPAKRREMMEKRAAKIDHVRADLPKGIRGGDRAARVGIIGCGMQSGVIAEASERLNARGTPVQYLQVRTLWPVLDETAEFIRSCDHVYVVEHNGEGQLAHLLDGHGAFGNLRSLTKNDGVPFRCADLVRHIATFEANTMHGDAA